MNDELIGTRKGDYEILSVLGAGGMGKVYKVRNVLSDRVEAMKVLLPNLADQKDLVDRFLREIKVLAALNHPNIASMHTALTIGNELVMIMEFVEGTTLDGLIERGAIPCANSLNYISQVLSALGYAHQQQVIHRDIKPANMMLTSSGVVKLMDFGIARSGREMNLTMTGTTLGSVAYMSPEQVTCQKIDARSDLYSVGVSLYELVTGQRPFTADSNFSIMKAHLQDLPKRPIDLNPGLPESVSKLILMALEKDPANRFQTADAFRNAIESVAAEFGPAEGATRVLSPAKTGPNAETLRLTPTPVPPPSTAPARVTPTPVPTPHPVTAPTARQPMPAPTMAAPSATQMASPPPPMPPQQVNVGGKRGLYITLGAVIVVVLLVMAGISMPRFFGTRANDQSASQSKSAPPVPAKITPQPAQPADNGAASASAPAPAPNADTSTPAEISPAAEASKLDSNAKEAANPEKKQAAKAAKADAKQQAEAAAPAQPAGPDPAELAALDDEVSQLSGRAAAVNSSLDNLQRQQAAQGLGLRGDMVAAQQRMQAFMAKAQAAIQAQDVKSARKYIDMTEAELEKLEKFLGR